MRLYAILLLLAIDGLSLDCCEGKSDELISGERPWKEDDWSGNSASSIGEDDELTGFDSGSSANDKEHNSENPRTSPRITRRFSKKRFVTSGNGEDSNGSGENNGSKSNSHGRKDQGSTNEEFDSIMGLAKIGDAIDVMKKLKKEKSDEELVKKLKSGPESLGVAFKTFEQLSGLWISVMHRIWRVWKAKGAKVVMHSIVDNLVNNTGRAITQKVGDFLRTKIGTVKDPNAARGSATFKDEGSTRPETSHRLNTLRNKKDIPLAKVSINFIKNISSKAKKEHEKTWPSNKTVKATIEKVKVSFTSKNMNDSTRIQTSKDTSQHSKNKTSLAKKIALDSTNINVTAKSENSFKTANSSSTNVSKVESAASLDNEHPFKKHKRLESGEYKNAGNVSLGDTGKKVESNHDTGRVRQVMPVNGRTPKVTQHVDKDSLRKQQANATIVLSDTQTENNRVMSSSLKLQKADTQVKNTSSDKHANSIDQNVKMEGHHGNINNSSLQMNSTREKVVISEKATDAAKDTAENTRVLEKLKINFLKKNERSYLDQNSSHTTQDNALNVQRKSESFIQNENRLYKTDSKQNKMDLSNTSQSTGNGLLDKVVLRLDKTDAIKNRTTEQFRNKTFENNSTASATTSGKSEKIVVNFYGKKETHKDNKTNTFVDVAKGPGRSHSSATDNSSENNKVTKTSFSRGVVKMPQEHNRKRQKGGSHNTTNPPGERDRTQNNVAGNSTQLLDKGVAKDRVQVEQVHSVSNDSRNLKNDSVHPSMTKTSNEKRALLTNKKSQGAEEKLKISDHSPKTIAKIVEVQEANPIQKRVESQTLLKANGNNQKAIKQDKLELEKKFSQDNSSTASSRNIKRPRNTTSSSLSNTSTSVTPAPPAKTVSDHSPKSTRESPKRSTEFSRKVYSPVESRVGRKGKSENSKVVSSGAVGMQIHHKKSDVTHTSGSGASHNTDSKIKHDTDNDTLHDSGSGSGMPHGESEPESHTTNDLVTGVTSGPTRDVTKKQDGSHGNESSVAHVPNNGVLHHSESDSPQKSKGIVIFGPRSDVKHDPEGALTKPSYATDITTERSTHARNSRKLSRQLKVSSTRLAKKPSLTSKNDGRPHNTASSTEDRIELTKSKKQIRSKSVAQDSKRRKKEEHPQSLKTLEHHILRQDIARNDDNNKRIKNENNSSRLDTTPQKATNVDNKTAQSQQVDVLTSRTPPTSLLTTSNDNNAYSIKEIVQGPNGSSLVDVHSDGTRIHGLERKVVKLENEVTVLETAMAGLANRLLVIEHKSGHPKPTIPAFLLPPKEGTPRHEHPIHSQQQTTVYISKDLTATPQIPAPQSGAERIVIPISSMYPEGERQLSTHSASIHEVDDDLESKGKDVITAPQIPAPQNGPARIVIPISSLYPGGERHLSTHSDTIHKVDDDLKSKDDSRSEGKLEDSTHEALPLGARYAPTSEAHAVVRPIVNIIVPNNRADVLSTGATCLPRCQNGGRCLDGNTCRCPTFFSGDHCERFSLRDLLESRKLRSRPYRKVQRLVVSESPDQQDLDGTFRLDSGAPAFDYRDLNLSQDIEPDKTYVAKQQTVEIPSSSNSANAQGVTRRRQLILEI